MLAEGELREDSVVKESLTTAADGKRYSTMVCGLEMILALGYRVRMPLLEADSQTLVTETSHDLDLTAQRRHIAPQRRHQHVLSILGF